MASPSGPSRPVPIGEPRGADEPAGSEAPHPGGDALHFGPLPCPWRTSEFHDQECSRFFDCPSHILERKTSTEQVRQAPRVPGGATGETSEAHNANQGTLGRVPIDAIEIPNTKQTTDDQSQQDAESSPALPTTFGTANSAAAQRNEPMYLPIPTSSMVERTDDYGISSRDSDPSHSQGTSTSFLGNHQAAERYTATSERPDLPERPTINGSGDSAPLRTHSAPTVRTGQASQEMTTRQSPARVHDGGSSDFALPRWQPDAEVTYCPICHTQFSIFVRKHHCRKCGRVVCNSCSPHRIIIPHQYIVRPPGSETSLPPSLFLDSLASGYSDIYGPSGGERVRLCNPCVPDPNTAPPQSPTPSAGAAPRPSSQRPRSGSAYGVAHTTTDRYGAVFTAGRSSDTYQYYSPRWRSITLASPDQRGNMSSPSHHRISTTYQSSLDHFLAAGPSGTTAPSRRNRHSSFGDSASSSRHRALPPPPQIAEEDECPICHRELPPRALTGFETLRESHIIMCIQTHSTYGSPRAGQGESLRRTGMYTYAATEKDCIDDAECTICLEEFTVGVSMARLECLCRFHKACISAWFLNHPGRCPVHQHDGFGF